MCRIRLAVLVIGIVSFTHQVYSLTNYVSLSGQHIPPFTNWFMAATNIQDAVAAAQANNMIRVDDGLYNLSGCVTITQGITLASVNGPAAILDGTGSNGCLYIDESATISGFSIQSGSNQYGGGIYCDGGGTVQNCRIQWNTAYNGGGIYLNGGGCVTQCVFLNNHATHYGGGIYSEYRALIIDCAISNNTADARGGGLYGKSRTAIVRCTLMHNTAELGGGIQFFHKPGPIVNSFISRNTALDSGGGIHTEAGSPDISNCTIVYNTARQGGGIYADVEQIISNSIIYYNEAIIDPNIAKGHYAVNCCVPGYAASSNGVIAAPDLLGRDNPHILGTSPCIDAGNTNLCGYRDIDFEPRQYGTAVDIGCDEYIPGGITGALAVAISQSRPGTISGVETPLEADIRGKASTVIWSFGDGTSWTNNTHVAHAWNTTGTFTVILEARNETSTENAAATNTLFVVQHYDAHVSMNGSHAAPFINWSTAATTIQAAIDAVITGTVYGAGVVVTNGGYSRGGYTSDILNRVGLYKPVTVRSVNGPEDTTINGSVNIRCAYMVRGAVLDGFTLSGTDIGGVSKHGGGVYLAGGGVVTNCIIYGNKAEYGAGAFCSAGGIITRCELGFNQAKQRGGGVFAGRNSRIDKSILYNNRAGQVGGGMVLNGRATVADSVISNNYMSNDSGTTAGVYCGDGACVTNCIICCNWAYNKGAGLYMDGYVTVIACSIRNNESHGDDGEGGGILCEDGVVRNCVIYGNEADDIGGGIRLYDKGVICNSIIENNEAGTFGGGIYNGGGTVRNCLIIKNKATKGGGVLYNSGELQSCTITRNNAQYGHGVYVGTGRQAGPPRMYSTAGTVLRNCIVYGNGWQNVNDEPGINENNCIGWWSGGGTNIITDDPEFADDYQLGSNSPCINAGVATDWMTAETDLAGTNRVLYDYADIGAYEFATDTLWGWFYIEKPFEKEIDEPFVFHSLAVNTNTVASYYVWDFNNDGSNEFITVVQTAVWYYAYAGTYSVRLTVSNTETTAAYTRKNCITVIPEPLLPCYIVLFLAGAATRRRV